MDWCLRDRGRQTDELNIVLNFRDLQNAVTAASIEKSRDRQDIRELQSRATMLMAGELFRGYILRTDKAGHL